LCLALPFVKFMTVRLPDALVGEFEQESRARRVSKSDVMRERLSASPPAHPDDSLAGILQESWRAAVPAGPPGFRSPKKQKLAEMIRAKKLRR
jgi:hypothetical protein